MGYKDDLLNAANLSEAAFFLRKVVHGKHLRTIADLQRLELGTPWKRIVIFTQHVNSTLYREAVFLHLFFGVAAVLVV